MNRILPVWKRGRRTGVLRAKKKKVTCMGLKKKLWANTKVSKKTSPQTKIKRKKKRRREAGSVAPRTKPVQSKGGGGGKGRT